MTQAFEFTVFGEIFITEKGPRTWSVKHKDTGLGVAYEKTRAGAVEEAKERLKKHGQKAVADAIQQHKTREERARKAKEEGERRRALYPGLSDSEIRLVESSALRTLGGTLLYPTAKDIEWNRWDNILAARELNPAYPYIEATKRYWSREAKKFKLLKKEPETLSQAA